MHMTQTHHVLVGCPSMDVTAVIFSDNLDMIWYNQLMQKLR